MESEPKSVIAIRVHELLSNFIATSPDTAVEKLTRVFIFLATQIKNEDSFLGALYGQEALDETPLGLVRTPIQIVALLFFEIKYQQQVFI